jgi:hypothetical protein
VDTALLMHLITVLAIILFKIAALIVGYLLAKLGYDLLIKGITGQFQFKGDFKGVKADIVSASPGTLFIVLATVILIFTLIADKPFSTRIVFGPSSMQQEAQEKPELPQEPPIQNRDKKELR